MRTAWGRGARAAGTDLQGKYATGTVLSKECVRRALEYTSGTLSFMIRVYRKHYVLRNVHTAGPVPGMAHMYNRHSPWQE